MSENLRVAWNRSPSSEARRRWPVATLRPNAWARKWAFVTPALLLPAILLPALLAPAAAVAQGGPRGVPSMGYGLTFSELYSGDYVNALNDFKAEGRGAIKTVNALWIDSISYHTMVGDCHYHLGQLPQALQHYNAALDLFLAYPNWMMSVQFPPSVRAATMNGVAPCPWGAPARQTAKGQFPDRVLVQQGQVNNNNVVRNGGVVQNPQLFPVNVNDIARCIAQSLRRRAELMGPVAAQDINSTKLINTLSNRPAPPNHWSQSWIDCQLGMAYLGAGRIPQAKAALQNSLMAAGEFDHPLTAMALLELGKISLAEQNFQAAAVFFREASISGYFFLEELGMADTIEEALRWGTVAHLMQNDQNPYPPLQPASAWAKQKGLKALYTSLLIAGAENFSALGRPDAALRTLNIASGFMNGRSALSISRMGARYNFVSAQIQYQLGNLAPGDTALAQAMKYMTHGSVALFQIALSDNLFVDGSIRPRQAMELYGTVLRDPNGMDWSYEPIESMAVLSIPHPLAYEHWFLAAIAQQEHEKALEISDLCKRHRFFSTVAFGGRLDGLRWVLEAPTESLSQQAQLERQRLLQRYPVYDQLAQQVKQLRRQLLGKPLVAPDEGSAKQQATELGQISELSLKQEAILREIAVRREHCTLAFPWLRTTKEIQEGLPAGHGVLSFFATAQGTFVFLITNKREDYATWKLGPPANIHRELSLLLRAMGSMDANRQITTVELASDDWKRQSRDFFVQMVKDCKKNIPGDFEELIIVPDGPLWYTPWEALQVDSGNTTASLSSKIRLRCVPFAAMAVTDARFRRTNGNTAIALGRMFTGEDADVAQDCVDRTLAAVPQSSQIRKPLPAPSNTYGCLFDRLIVFDDISLDKVGAYGFAPARFDEHQAGSTLGSWMMLPWQGPDQVILPGFRTSAESGLLKQPVLTSGSDIFLTVCAMMASGSRTILLSRWRSGGQTSYDLVREFAQELPFSRASDAWQRSIQVVSSGPIDVEHEPRVTYKPNTNIPKANHPFFWAGYLLVDTGVMPQKAEIEKADDVADKANPDKANPGKPGEKEPAAKNAAEKKPADQERGTKPDAKESDKQPDGADKPASLKRPNTFSKPGVFSNPRDLQKPDAVRKQESASRRRLGASVFGR